MGGCETLTRHPFHWWEKCSLLQCFRGFQLPSPSPHSAFLHLKNKPTIRNVLLPFIVHLDFYKLWTIKMAKLKFQGGFPHNGKSGLQDLRRLRSSPLNSRASDDGMAVINKSTNLVGVRFTVGLHQFSNWSNRSNFVQEQEVIPLYMKLQIEKKY